MAKWKNIPCNAGCSRGIVFVKRPVQRTDKNGKTHTEVESVPEECKVCDGSGYIHVPGD